MKPNTKGIFIDSENQTITETEVSSLEDIYKLLKIRLFAVVRLDDNADLIVDDEGLLKDNHVFRYYTTRLAGNGLVVGLNKETGEWEDSPLTLEEVETDVKFLGYFESQF